MPYYWWTDRGVNHYSRLYPRRSRLINQEDSWRLVFRAQEAIIDTMVLMDEVVILLEGLAMAKAWLLCAEAVYTKMAQIGWARQKLQRVQRLLELMDYAAKEAVGPAADMWELHWRLVDSPDWEPK